MTTTWLRKLLLLVVILVMPLQGVAMASTLTKCHEKAAAELAALDHDHGDGGHHHHDSSDDGTTTSMNGHLCGHLVLHVPASFGVVNQPQFVAWIASPADSYTPYFPEHPRRPPRV